jgi:hypothetical protein
MKFLIHTVLLLVIAFVFELFLPWWSIALATGIGAAVICPKNPFLTGFSAIVVLWVGKALITQLQATTDLAAKIAALLMVNQVGLLIALMALLGGCVGGLSALTGAYLSDLLRSKS